VVKGGSPSKTAVPADADDPRRHLSALPSWREFTVLAPARAPCRSRVRVARRRCQVRL
jgi:hypothetical protein